MSFTEKLPTIEFSQTWGGVEWVSQQKYNNGDLEKQIENIETPDENICKALSSMFKAYYPNDILNRKNSDIHTQENDCLPWEYHKFIKNGEKYQDKLKDILRNNWILSWHWRAILPTLNSWNPQNSEYKTIIQISHFRKWEMLLCYKVETEIINEVKNNLKEIKLEDKELLRAPLFGISHRLKGWDTYRLFYSPIIKEYINKKVIEFENNPHKIELPTLLGRHDCYYIIDDVKSNGNGFDWKLKSFIEVEPEISNPDKLLNGKSYKNPLDLIEIPSFGHKTIHEGIPQLLASDNYCEAIYELMEILNDPTAKSVLLIAPPGSGKEKLAEFAFHCRENEVRGKFIATTFAGLNATDVSKLLFSCSADSLNFPFEQKEKDKPFIPDKNDGLLLKALNGALFIDEIDKADRSVRDLLLRVLESGEMTDPATGRIIKIGKRSPLYIFSGSMSRKNMLQEPPPDFWTRISHVIEVSHPLAIDDIDKSRKVVKEYLWMFWLLHVKEYMNKKGLSFDSKKPLTEQLVKFNLALFSFLINEQTVSFVCDILSEEISGRGKPLVSIRTLRSMVARSLFKLVEIIQFSKFDDEPIELYKSKNKEEFKNLNFETWFNKLLEIVSISLYDKQKENKQIDPIELGVLESFKTAIRQGTQLAQ